MWISKKEYEDLLDYKDRYVEEYKTVSRLRDDITYYKSEYRELEEEIDELERQLEEYKRKYADEVQKRLGLTKYIDSIRVVSKPNYKIDKTIEEIGNAYSKVFAKEK